MFRLFTKALECSIYNNMRICSKSFSFKPSIIKTSIDQRFMIIDVNKIQDSTKCQQLRYPLIWLRDNCQCSSCFDAQSKSRTIDWTQLDFRNAQPKSISVSKLIFKVFLNYFNNQYSILNYIHNFFQTFVYICNSNSRKKKHQNINYVRIHR